MNKKIILTSILAISFAMPAVAEITTGSTCDTSNLGQSENNSTANVEATWIPKSYHITYYCNCPGCLRDIDMAGEMCDLSTNPESCVDDMDAVYGYTYAFMEPSMCHYAGHTFAGWSCTDSSENTTIYNASQSITWNIDSNLTCNGQWTANRINIDWFSDGARVAQNYCEYDSTITLPETPNKTGYTFTGWKLHDYCADLSTQSACDENEDCFWYPSGNKCMFKDDNLNGCANVSDSESCNALGYCQWDEELKIPGCTTNSIAFCSEAVSIKQCRHFTNCTWDETDGVCKIAASEN